MAVAAILGVRQLFEEIFPPPPPHVTSIVFVLDTSSAMRHKFHGTTKFMAAQNEILDLVSIYSNAATSLRLFGDNCESEYRDPALDLASHDREDYKTIFGQTVSLEKSNFPHAIELALNDLLDEDASSSENKFVYAFVGSTKSCGGLGQIHNLGANDVRFFGLGVLKRDLKEIKNVLGEGTIAVAVRNPSQLQDAVEGAARHDQAGRPHVPSLVTGDPGDGSVTLTWRAPDSNGGSQITSYRITPSIAGNEQEPVLTNSKQTSHTVSELTNGVAYTFTVAGINDVAPGPESRPAGPYTPTGPEATTPDPPTALMGSPGNGSVDLTWTAPDSDGGSEITGYQIIPYIAGTAQSPVLTGSPQTTYTVSELTNNVAYTFTVAAINEVDTGPDSAESLEYVPTEPSSKTSEGP